MVNRNLGWFQNLRITALFHASKNSEDTTISLQLKLSAEHNKVMIMPNAHCSFISFSNTVVTKLFLIAYHLWDTYCRHVPPFSRKSQCAKYNSIKSLKNQNSHKCNMKENDCEKVLWPNSGLNRAIVLTRSDKNRWSVQTNLVNCLLQLYIWIKLERFLQLTEMYIDFNV